MTVSMMADIAGVSPDTIRRKVGELFPGKMEARKRTSFTQEEATKVLAEVRKANFVSPELPQDASALPQIAAVVKSLIPAMAEAFRLALGGQPPAPPSPPAIEAPALTPRHELRRLIGRGSRLFSEAVEPYRAAWNELYTQAYYRMGRNIKYCAENRGKDPLDYAEDEGLLPELVAIAREIFGRAA